MMTFDYILIQMSSYSITYKGSEVIINITVIYGVKGG